MQMLLISFSAENEVGEMMAFYWPAKMFLHYLLFPKLRSFKNIIYFIGLKILKNGSFTQLQIIITT